MNPVRPLAVLCLTASLVACDGDDPFPALPGVYELETAGGVATPILISEGDSIRVYFDSLYVEFAEADTANADGIYAGRWRVEYRHAQNDSTYLVTYTEHEGTWSYTSDRDIELRYANGGLRTRGTRERGELYLRQFFSFDIEDWIFERTSSGPDLIEQ